MKINLEETGIYHSPRSFIDRRGEPILIEIMRPRRKEAVWEMYLSYEPKASFNGLPPADLGSCMKWARDVTESAVNLVAISFFHGLVGHAALFTVSDDVCELLVVVEPTNQGAGIGTELTRAAIQVCYEVGFKKLWLCVESSNRVARHVYSKCGFQYLSRQQTDDMEMSFDLLRYHQSLDETITNTINRNVISVSQDLTCREAAVICVTKGIGALPVLDRDDRVAGMLTVGDLVAATNPDQRISDVVTASVITLHEDATIAKAVRLFHSRRVRCIPVTDKDKRLVGIITHDEILAYYLKTLWAEQPEQETV
jgi:CBS domain-containing protein/RimJ/RimL family protein N-acetyltransferase